jgi:hypothetical protein
MNPDGTYGRYRLKVNPKTGLCDDSDLPVSAWVTWMVVIIIATLAPVAFVVGRLVIAVVIGS